MRAGIAITVRATIPIAPVIIRSPIGLASPVTAPVTGMMVGVVVMMVTIVMGVVISRQRDRGCAEQTCQRQDRQEETAELSSHMNSFLLDVVITCTHAAGLLIENARDMPKPTQRMREKETCQAI